MSFEKEFKEVEQAGKALQGALNIPIVKYAVVGVLVIVGLFALVLLLKMVF